MVIIIHLMLEHSRFITLESCILICYVLNLLQTYLLGIFVGFFLLLLSFFVLFLSLYPYLSMFLVILWGFFVHKGILQSFLTLWI